MYNMSIKSGEDYSTLEKGIVILISDYELEGLKNIEIEFPIYRKTVFEAITLLRGLHIE